MKKYNKEELTQLIKDNPEELINTILELQNIKKYGLIWEEDGKKTKEAFEKSLKTHLPILVEAKEREIKTDSSKSTNILIEGDNYHALKLLQTTHKNKINVIYIDPPYNTGNKDFKYNDKFVDKEDSYRHSKWLNFMSKRLKLAKELLSDNGVIFISIDDNEMAQLRLLCDEIFGENNFLSTIIWKKKTSTGTDKSNISTISEYILVYSKNLSMVNIKKQYKELEGYNLKDSFFNIRGKYKLNKLDRGTLGYVDSLDYPIYDGNGICVYPNNRDKKENDGWRWRWSKEKVEWGIENGFIEFKKNKNHLNVYYKIYEKVNNDNIPFDRNNILPYDNFIPDTIGGTTTGTTQLKKIFNKTIFNYPKPVDLIKYLIDLINNKNAIILDFFAGSGTTGQAVLELNNKDGGTRQFILCTNNEISEDKEKTFFKEKEFLNNISLLDFKKTQEYLNQIEKEEYKNLGICREVTYERIKKVINGYITPKGEKIKALGGNLKYYKCDFIKKEQDITDNIENFQEYAIELLKIKENVFDLYKKEETYSMFINNNKMLVCINEIDNSMELNNIKKEFDKYEGEKVIYINTAEEPVSIPNELEDYKNFIHPMPKEIIDILNKQ